ncbi:hypothetical protein COLO4_10947 [Corchorus olitorius]|uniref:Uncharacterized protein n=1 Tax=Corchorus olitorius TaxID=93759 RepID=A0A1R3K6J1_9ROSI|nr:hypothetical protein COLO4_10947 [Corchorus olitorius]
MAANTAKEPSYLSDIIEIPKFLFSEASLDPELFLSMAGANEVSLKLLVDVRGQRVLFAEGGKDFVDFLFNILSLPLSLSLGF